MNNAEENIFVKRKCNASIKSFLMYLRDNPHNNLPMIVEVAEDEYIMEYINGMTLSEFVEKEDISFAMARDFILQLLSAVEVLHKFSIVHRDINPDNIIISTDGTLKLIDFDIAREIVEDKTRDTQILGTVGYAAPEQFGFTQTDERCDIYAIGIVYKFILGDKLNKESLPSYRMINKIIIKCTQIDPDKRYKNVLRMRRDVARERFTPHRFLDIVPGFRSRNIYKMIIAIFVYVNIFLGYNRIRTEMVLEENPSANLFGIHGIDAVLLAYLIYGFLFFAVGTNFLNLADRIKLPFTDRWVKQVIVMLFLLILGSIIVYLFEPTMEGIIYGNPIIFNMIVFMHFVL